MEDIVKWLLKTERNAAAFYRDVAALFERDDTFNLFMRGLADDEEWHYAVLMDSVTTGGNQVPEDYRVNVSETIRLRIDRIFGNARECLSAGRMTREQAIETIADAEFSEWNDIFVYVVDTFKHTLPSYRSIAPKMQNHLREISHFLEKQGHTDRQQKIEQLPQLWEERILVVDDFEPITDIFSAVLEAYGSVETASNGRQALKKAISTYYSVIVSDIDMPEMNGIDFYRALRKQYGDISKRFIFMSGNPQDNALDFFSRNGLRFLQKPVDLENLRQSVREILNALTEGGGLEKQAF